MKSYFRENLLKYNYIGIHVCLSKFNLLIFKICYLLPFEVAQVISNSRSHTSTCTCSNKTMTTNIDKKREDCFVVRMLKSINTINECLFHRIKYINLLIDIYTFLNNSSYVHLSGKFLENYILLKTNKNRS